MRIGHLDYQFIIVIATLFAATTNAADKPGVKAVILYMYDDATVGSNVITMEVDKNTFMGVIKSSQANAKVAKPLKFGQDNGFFSLLEGQSSAFSFGTSSGIAECDCKCVKKVTTTTPAPTTTAAPTTTTRPITTTTTRPPVITSRIPPTYLPPTSTPPTTSTPAPTYLPPCPSGGSGPYCCVNGAENVDCCANGGSGPDCCTNGGRGKFCCKNGENNPQCLTSRKPECSNGGSGPYCCTNGANNVDCCKNGGIGKYCCVNGANNSDCCENGGKGKYCCANGANNPSCEVATRTTKPFKGDPYLPVATKSTTRGPTTTDNYTYGSRGTNTYRYSWTYGPWSYATRNYTVVYRETSTTPKYDTRGKNGITYNGESDNNI